ncbi:ATP-grasp domain-containing protein [Erythrobacter crassostreae]|uniref:Prokaryotic glutathione synthetase ATP-binding domain-containing protein n=1 Tax=Erythrobacter crassostreae TaxID=2828328 RepID=A0A9X1F4B5_9SPHN|nr:hypothetical protein [Erythrobacter crassostrea]MBV7259564.1 hypothetical protein [Erythrobacter crassostrea]
MTKIGFLACETTLPEALGGSGERRGDAFEHDLMIAAFEPAFAAQGLDLCVIDWEAPIEAFEGIALVLLGSSWNYQDKPEAFLGKLDALAANGIKVCNPPDLVRWNATKTYLRDLGDKGARTIPTLWRKAVTAEGALEAMEVFDTDRIVVKRQIGAGALGQELISKGSLPDANWNFAHAAMLQPFLPAIAEEGELSFVFIDGELSHVLRKLPAKGDYRIQSLYGGSEEVHQPTAAEAGAAAAIVAALPFSTPLYARIDMLRAEDGALMVMEAELIEPYLYPEQGPELGPRLAQAIAKRIS